MAEIQITELVGELRRAGRLYEAFRKADEIATILTEHGVHLNNLTSQIEQKTQERDALEKACQEREQVAEVRVEASQKEVEDAKKYASDLMRNADAALAKAKKDAEGIVLDAQKEAEDVVTGVKDQKEAKEKLEREVADLTKVLKEMQDQKQKLLDTFK